MSVQSGVPSCALIAESDGRLVMRCPIATPMLLCRSQRPVRYRSSGVPRNAAWSERQCHCFAQAAPALGNGRFGNKNIEIGAVSRALPYNPLFAGLFIP